MTHLADFDITARKVRQGDNLWSIAVPAARVAASIKYLQEVKALRDRPDPLPDSGILSSREDQKFKFERALSTGIEDTLLALPGVHEARVHLNLAAVDPFEAYGSAEHPGSGSVLLLVAEDFGVGPRDITRLVSGASGVSEEAIIVVIKPLPGAGKAAAPGLKTIAVASNPEAPGPQDYWRYAAGGGSLLIGLLLCAAAFLRPRRLKECQLDAGV